MKLGLSLKAGQSKVWVHCSVYFSNSKIPASSVNSFCVTRRDKMRHREDMLKFYWWQICVLALCLHVCVGQDNCPPTYKPYGCRTCFTVHFDTSFAKNFTSGRAICQTQGVSGTRDLLTFSNREQRDLIRTYLKLNSVNNRLWVGMRYDDDAMLVDIDGNDVDTDALGIKFDEEVAAAAGLCVSVMLSSDSSEVLFYRQQCSEAQGFICIINSIGLTIDSLTSAPDGYGLAGKSVTLECNFQPTQLPINITWTFTSTNSDTSVILSDEDITINPRSGYGRLVVSDFQAEHSGNYRCSISVLSDENVLGGITSVEKTVQLAVAPTLSRHPEDRSFYTGAVSFIECGVSDDTFPPATVRWYKSDDEVLTNDEEITSDGSKYLVSPNTKNLLIARSDATDTGTYRCYVANPAGNMTSRGGGLTLTFASDVPVADRDGMLVLRPADVTAELGSDVTYDGVGTANCIDCDRYSWRVFDPDSNPVAILPFDVNTRGELSSSTYTNIQFFDSTNINTFITAEVSYNFGGDAALLSAASLTVVERASITSVSSNTMFMFGNEAQLWCVFRGTPSPAVQWYFKGRPLSTSEEFSIVTTDSDKATPGNTSLTIKNFQVKDTGSYQCVLTNYLASAARDFRLCGRDGTPGAVTEVSIQPVSQTQVRVIWSPPIFANSDADLLQYRLYWADVPDAVTLTTSTATQTTDLLPLSDDGHLIESLSTVYRVSVIIVAYSYIGMGEESSPLSSRTYGSVPAELPGSVVATRSSDNKTIMVTWNEVVPKRDEGEGEVYRYDVSFFKCGDEDNRSIRNGSHPPVTSMNILDVDPDTEYTIQVRVTVLIQSEPDDMFAHGDWSGEPCKEPVMGDGGGSDSDFTIIIIIVAVAVGLLLIFVISVLIACYAYQLGQRGRYFPAKSEERKGTLRLKEQQQKVAIFSNGQSTGLTDDSMSHPKTNGSFDA